MELEPRVRHDDGQFYQPDLAVHITSSRIVIADVQVSWDGSETPMSEIHNRKKGVYKNPKFIQAAKKTWPGKDLIFRPVILGARGIWPPANRETEEALDIPLSARHSCVKSTLSGAQPYIPYL